MDQRPAIAFTRGAVWAPYVPSRKSRNFRTRLFGDQRL